jgi:hypothetical protein
MGLIGEEKMASDSFKGVLFALVLFALFGFLVVYAVVEMGNNYGKSSSEIGDGALDDTSFQSSVQNVSDNAENYRARFESGEVDDVDDASGIFGVATDMISMITAPFTLLGQVLDNILGVPVIVTNIILGLVGITLLLSIWRLLKQGD